MKGKVWRMGKLISLFNSYDALNQTRRPKVFQLSTASQRNSIRKFLSNFS